MNQLANLNKDMFHHPLSVSNNVRDIQIDVYAIDRAMKDVSLVNNFNELETTIAVIDSLELNVFEKFKSVKKQFLGSSKDVEDAQKYFLILRPIWEKTVNKIQQGEKRIATNIIRSEAKEFF